jgi:small subunit ribosomal protein S18
MKMLKVRRKRVCQFCEKDIEYIDFKDDRQLIRFLTEQGKIIPRHTSGTCAKHQRQLARAVKRARQIALIPFVTDFTR